MLLTSVACGFTVILEKMDKIFVWQKSFCDARCMALLPRLPCSAAHLTRPPYQLSVTQGPHTPEMLRMTRLLPMMTLRVHSTRLTMQKLLCCTFLSTRVIIALLCCCRELLCAAAANTKQNGDNQSWRINHQSCGTNQR